MKKIVIFLTLKMITIIIYKTASLCYDSHITMLRRLGEMKSGNLYREKTTMASSTGKVILSGEHAIIYDQPALVFPIPLRVYVTVEACDPSEAVEIQSDIYTGKLDQVPKALKGLVILLETLVTRLGQEVMGFRIKVKSDIPMARGLGSSAAVAIALTRALFGFFDKTLSIETLISFVTVSENHWHGRASGIDMKTEVMEQPLFFKTRTEAQLIKPPLAFYFVVADSGVMGQTKEAVSYVREAIKANKNLQVVIQEIGKLTIGMREDLLSGDMDKLGEKMSRNHACLKDLGVSCPELDSLVEGARVAGALGSKMTGGGLGGCILALADSEESAINICNKLFEEYQVNVWWFSFDGKETGTIKAKRKEVSVGESNGYIKS